MIRLSRTIRFALTDGGESPIANSWAGWPSTNRIVPHLTLICVVQGEPDPDTGYVCNIKDIDDLIRKVVVQDIIPGFARGQSAESTIRKIYNECQARWNSATEIDELSLQLSPFLKFTIGRERSDMIRLTEQFEFSAAHRLHCDQLSPEQNRSLFGKCNNPAGHGHNYIVEVSVEGHGGGAGAALTELPKFEATVKKLVIDRLDHKHLNQDVEYFSTVNPSVENIAIAIWNWLEGQIADANLVNIRVYETPKTWADYSG